MSLTSPPHPPSSNCVMQPLSGSVPHLSIPGSTSCEEVIHSTRTQFKCRHSITACLVSLFSSTPSNRCHCHSANTPKRYTYLHLALHITHNFEWRGSSTFAPPENTLVHYLEHNRSAQVGDGYTESFERRRQRSSQPSRVSSIPCGTCTSVTSGANSASDQSLLAIKQHLLLSVSGSCRVWPTVPSADAMTPAVRISLRMIERRCATELKVYSMI